MPLVYGMANCSGWEAFQMYHEKYPSRKIPSHSFFATSHWRLCETGSLDMHKPDAGYQRISWTVDVEERVVQALKRNPSTNIWVVFREIHIPQTTVWHIVHGEELYAYHLQRVQALQPGDYSSRMDFAWWYLQEKAADWHFAVSILFTDEAAFSLDSVMNYHNLHKWTDENAHVTHLHTAQWKFSVNVWAGIVGDCLLGPYIISERLNGSMYLTFLQEVLPKMLNYVPMPIRQCIQFQHDIAPACFSTGVRAHLQQGSKLEVVSRILQL